jgi:diguanylate cyclase (GGDEF)-like protein
MPEQPAPGSSAPSVEEIAAAACADDLFLFRRIGECRFAHIGGAGRGVGWAGIIEVGIGDEPVLAAARQTMGVTRTDRSEPWRVFGPYYTRSIAVAPLDDDAFVVFGSLNELAVDVTDSELVELARAASEAIGKVSAAKQLADELEVVNALRDLLLSPSETFEAALQSLVTQAAAALSCEIGIAFMRESGAIAISDPLQLLDGKTDGLADVLEQIDAPRRFPLCIQDASENDLPAPFSFADGVLAYYLLELTPPAAGFLLVAHTDAAPRGFTLLCQSLGARLVEASGPFLAAALARDSLQQNLARAAVEARCDPLTGLANRLAWDEAVADEPKWSGKMLSVVQLDCRGLKRANDSFGHTAGDHLLRRVAEIVTDAVRADDLVARIGGDEFAILLPDADELVSAAVVTRIEQAVASASTVEQIKIGVAIGVATSHEGDARGAQRLADERMIAAKRADDLKLRAVG